MMNSFDQFAGLISQAAANSLWQGAVILAVLLIVLRVARGSNAATRSVILLAGLCGLLALFAMAIERGMPHPQTAAVAPSVRIPDFSPPATSLSPGDLLLPAWILRGTAALWVLISGFKLIQLLRSYLFLRQLKRSCTPLPDVLQTRLQTLACGLPVSGGVSSEIPAPITLGLGRAVILLPEDMLQSLDPADLDHVLVHELAHIRRGDDWTRLAQKLLEVPLFYHPAAHWISRRLDLEREIACDDSVVLETGQVRTYARCLTKLADSANRAQDPLLATGMLPGRSQLTRRILMLLNQDRKISRTLSLPTLLLAGVLLLVPLFLLAHNAPMIGVSMRDQGLQTMRAAELEMQKAEAQMLKAAEDKKRATDEQSLARAELDQQAAQMQMRAAHRKLNQAREAIHCDSKLRKGSEPVLAGRPGSIDAAPTLAKQLSHRDMEEAIAEGVVEGVEGAIVGGVEDGVTGGVEDGVHDGVHSQCPLEQQKAHEEAMRKMQSVMRLNLRTLEEQKAHMEAMRKTQEVIRLDIQTRLEDLKMRKVVRVVVPKMDLRVRDERVVVPEVSVDLPESQIQVEVPSSDWQ